MPFVNSLTASTPDTLEAQSRTGATTRMLVFLVVWAISIGYMATHLKVGWVPHDEGMLGLSAERALHGELPHRDFDDYTGGLTFVHAFAFREFGVNSASMRFVLFAAFVAWVPTVYYVASRFGPPFVAAGVTLLAIAWSVPNYPGPMPSWYNLFFATAGAAALLRYIERGSRGWLFLAGICGGLSALAKVTAAYYVVGALLFFIFREQDIANAQNRGSPARARLYRAIITVALATFLALLFRMIRMVPGISGLIYFVLPTFGLVVLILAREFAGVAGKDRERFVTLVGLCAPFGAGIAIPLIVFVIPYARAGAVHDLMYGLLATSARAIRFASFDPQSPLMMVSMVPFIVLVSVAYECRRAGRVICGCIVALYGCALQFFAPKATLVYNLGWCSLATAIPALILGGAAMLWVSRGKEQLNILRQEQIMLLLCVTALCSLVQFPFAAPVYFFYVAPLVILSAMALFASTSRPPRFVFGVLIGIYLLFPTLSVTRYQMGISHAPDGQTQRLSIPRAGGLRVDSTDARQYDELIPLVQSHAAGKFVYAAPDCPEVYFLSASQSPSRHYFDYAEDPAGRTERILDEVESLNINVVAISRDAQFTGPMWPDLRSALEQRYTHSAELGSFQVRWKK